MSRIEQTFSAIASAQRKALVAYLCMGDPSLPESIELAVAAAEAGADVLELGVPFSDPTADGPVIARAAHRAIHKGGATIESVIEAARTIRSRTKAPLVLFTYYNPVLTVGETRVVELAKNAGIDALLVVDLPPEEGTSLRSAAAAAGIALVPLAAPTSTDARIGKILASAQGEGSPRGFLYYVSMTGVTGSGSADFTAARTHAAALRTRSGWPVVIGFGISSPEAARTAAGVPGDGPDGVVVGTAIVRLIEQGTTEAERLTNVRGFIGSLRAALDAP